ncbi:succinate dehydrogenase cytochrome b subunit [Flavobacterium sp. MAH-1]|uniref:Succinate dehydrogenase cytochrome b subunit n=1 Tax=Flavobacterium agri TaxID=2743471 RepID=A0A7Y8Y2N2_9FLAO|nr:succinate dehydrogenase cytochrome b subunit [Flavobacterium agri]NUY81337.1 succinate dehydrogenase cytochrome b subunit [Flavobacterium agri]NYA71361.1 succinate dehydrogenase cytochrome b subunit [Flavobacterium agri]
MANSAFLKSSLAKKYWMALTGLFLCLFLIGHLLGNLQLLSTEKYGAALRFNQYAHFMTTNPAVKVLSWLTYISILFHAIDGFWLTVQNRKARPVGYVKNSPSANTTWASRNMALLGSLILLFIVTHMASFWGRMHFDKNMPLYKVEIEAMGQKQSFYQLVNGQFVPVEQVAMSLVEAREKHMPKYIHNKTELFDTNAKIQIGELYKDLYKITVDFFKQPTYGLLYVILYVISMAVLAFHLSHGLASSFQSIGMSHPKYSPFIDKFGLVFSIVVSVLFAILPVYIYFVL